MTRRRWVSLLLAALLLFASCAPKEPPEAPSESVPPASVPAAEPEEESKPDPENQTMLGEEYRDPSWYLSEEVLLLLEGQGISVSVAELSPLKKRSFTATLALSDDSGTVSFPVHIRFFPNSEDVRQKQGNVSAGKDWFAIYDHRDVSIYHPGKIDQPSVQLDTSALSNRTRVFLEVAYNAQMGWVTPMLLDGKDAFGFFRKDGSLEEATELKNQKGIFVDRYWAAGANDYVTCFNKVKNISLVPLEDGYVLFQIFSSSYIFSKGTKEFFLCDQVLRQEQEGITISFYLFDSSFANKFPQNDHRCLCIWEEKDGRSFSFFTGSLVNLHPSFGWNGEETIMALDFNKHQSRILGEYTRANVTMDFDRGTMDLEYLLRLEDLDSRDFDNPSHQSPDGRYILARACPDGGGDVLYWLETLYDTVTGEIQVVTISGGMYGGQGIVSFVDESRLWVHDYDGVQLYRIDGLEPLPLPFPLELGEAYLFGLGYDQRAGQYAVLYENVTDEESGFYYSRNSTDTYRLAVYSENGTQLMDFDTGIPLQSGMGGLSRFSLAVEDGVVTFGNYDRFYDYDTSKSYTCRILLDTQTVERKDL